MPSTVPETQPRLTHAKHEHPMFTSPQPSASVPSAHSTMPPIMSPAFQSGDSDHRSSVTSMHVASNVVLSKDELEPRIRTSCLLDLPRELRYKIYFFALGPGPIRLHFRGYDVDIIRKPEPLFAMDSTCHAPFGLYPWMRGSKQILSDTLNVIAQTSTFKLAMFLSKSTTGKSLAFNPLVFRQGSIHNILVRPTLVYKYSPESSRMTICEEKWPPELLDFALKMKGLAAEDFCLGVNWILVEERYSSLLRTFASNAGWEKSWEGKVHHVSIEISAFHGVDDPDDISMLTERAKCTARQLTKVEPREVSVEISNEDKFSGDFRFRKKIVADRELWAVSRTRAED